MKGKVRSQTDTDWAIAAGRTGEDRWGCGHIDGWGRGRELDGGGLAGASADRWTGEPTTSSHGRDDRRWWLWPQVRQGSCCREMDGGVCSQSGSRKLV